MKSVLISIQPYWVFLIIAKVMGWKIDKEKTIEVRKTIPKAENWNKVVKIYCSKDRSSFSRIPKEHQPLMERFLGKVIGEFACKRCKVFPISSASIRLLSALSLVPAPELYGYANGKSLHGWKISDLVIYDEPKPLSHLSCECKHFDTDSDSFCYGCPYFYEESNESVGYYSECLVDGYIPVKKPPQSWCYVEEK